MDLPRGQETEEFWRAHIEQAKKFKGSDTSYCRQQNLNRGKFSRYKIKFGAAKSRKVSSPSSFSKVEVVSERKPAHLPDPQWLATFLKYWMK